jgi:two-component system sensor histidine kinase DesK
VEHERARIARDLHDVLGHNLFLIALSADVAARHVDSEQAGGREIRSIARLAREAIRSARDVVLGTHQTALETELTEARLSLDLAGIQLELRHSLRAVPPEVEAILAWTVRESVTNVIRHSQASECRIVLVEWEGFARAEIVDDGIGSGKSETGSGLHGIRQRVASAGGHFTTGPLSTGGYRLSVELPLAVGDRESLQPATTCPESPVRPDIHPRLELDPTTV